MSTLESFRSKNRILPGVTVLLASAALSGCGIGGGGNKSGIAKCPSGYEGTYQVRDQDAVIAAYELAGQNLALDFKTSSSGTAHKRYGVAFNQLFNMKNSSGLFNANTANSNGSLKPDAYLADDPEELMCYDTEQKATVLSPNAIQARAILKSVDIQVNLNSALNG